MNTAQPLPFEGCDCDQLARRAQLIPIDIALTKGLQLAESVEATQWVSLAALKGRVLAESVSAPMALPPFNNSAMDGYALRAADLDCDQPLRVAGRVAAGQDVTKVGTVHHGEAFRIFTGAAIPAGADAVVMQEHVTRDGDMIRVNKPVPRGHNIRRKGEDTTPGATLLPAGRRLRTRDIAALAAVGLAGAKVKRRVRVAFFATGDELREPGEALAPGQIYNSNQYMMQAALDLPHVSLSVRGALPDDPVKLRAALIDAASDHDLIVTTGGVSVGEEDHMVSELVKAGGAVEVMKVAMKPGKPLTIGRLGGAMFLGLPGNPVAAYVTWHLIGSRLLTKMAGASAETPHELPAKLDHDTRRSPGRQEYRPARITGKDTDGKMRLTLLDASFSAKVSLICVADGFAVLPAERAELETGTEVAFLPF